MYDALRECMPVFRMEGLGRAYGLVENISKAIGLHTPGFWPILGHVHKQITEEEELMLIFKIYAIENCFSS